jgi:hypothetical protein
MARRGWLLSGLVAVAALAQAAARGDDRSAFSFSTRSRGDGGPAPPPQLPLESIPPGIRERVQSVLERPALSARAHAETFQATGDVYRWLLDHPDLTVKLWRQAGAKVSDIEDRGDGVYVWHDEHGSEIHWHSALKAPGLHVWYAEGKVKAASLLPLTSFRAVAILSYHEGQDTSNRPAIRHQVHFLLRCDSRAVALAAKILGASAPRMTEQYLGQLQLFYGGMAWYLGQDQERARRMYRQIGLALPEDAQR